MHRHEQIAKQRATDRSRSWACYVIGFIGFLISGNALCLHVGVITWFILRVTYNVQHGS